MHKARGILIGITHRQRELDRIHHGQETTTGSQLAVAGLHTRQHHGQRAGEQAGARTRTGARRRDLIRNGAADIRLLEVHRAIDRIPRRQIRHAERVARIQRDRGGDGLRRGRRGGWHQQGRERTRGGQGHAEAHPPPNVAPPPAGDRSFSRAERFSPAHGGHRLDVSRRLHVHRGPSELAPGGRSTGSLLASPRPRSGGLRALHLCTPSRSRVGSGQGPRIPPTAWRPRYREGLTAGAKSEATGCAPPHGGCALPERLAAVE